MNVARSKNYELLDQLAEEFVERFRRGERPALAEYMTLYPELAEEIRELFPALAEVEQADADQAPRPVKSPPQPMPSQIGDYRILQEIGRGGMGVVYEAEQKSLARRVALKVLPRSATQEARAVERFRREARAAAKLHHTNIVPIFEIGQDGDTHFYAMQFIQGQSLDLVLDELRRLRAISGRHNDMGGKQLRSNPHGPSLAMLTQSMILDRFEDEPMAAPAAAAPAPPRGSVTEVFSGDGLIEATPRPKEQPVAASPACRPGFHLPGSEDLSKVGYNPAVYFRSVARIGQQTAAALAHAHARGIIHRDIKPSNLLLDADGVIWITDFGLAKVDDSDLTHSGDMLGTLRYMAPERFAGNSDPRADLYGLGLSLYELLALRPAFDANDRLQLIEQIRQQEPCRPRDLDPTVPEDLETIVLRAMDKDAERRYRTADALAEDLRRFLANEPILARRVGPVERVWRWCRRKPLVAGLSAAVLGLLAVLTGVSTVAAVWLGGALEISEGHRKRAELAQADVQGHLADVEKANREKTEQLRESLLNHAHAARWSGRAGRRFDSLAALAKASEIRPGLDLRNQAIASMALADLRQVWSLEHDPLQSLVVAWDANLEHYALADHASGDISIRRVADRQETVRLPGSGTHAVVAKFSADGRFLAVKYHDDATLYFAAWDVVQARVVLRLPQGNIHNAFGFSPDSKRLAVATPDRRVTFHDLGTGEPTGYFSVKGWVYHLEFDPAGKYLALSLDSVDPIELRDASTGKMLRAIAAGSRARCVSFDREGKRLAVGCEDRAIRIWDLTRPALAPAVLLGHQAQVTNVQFVPNSDLLVTAGWDRITCLWDLNSRKELVQKPGSIFHADRAGTKLGALSPGNGAGLWEIAAADEWRIVKGWSIAFDPQSPVAVVGSLEGMAALDLSARQPPTVFGPPHRVLRFHPKERILVTLVADGQNGLAWSIKETRDDDGRRYHLGSPRAWNLPAPTQHQSHTISPDGHTVAVLPRSAEPWLLDWETLHIKSTLSPLPGVANLSFSPDGQWIAGGTWQRKNVKVWEVETGREVVELLFPQSAMATFSPDNQWLAINHAGETQLLEVGTWRKARRISRKNPDDPLGPHAFAPDGTVLAILLSGTKVLLANPRTGAELATLEQPNLGNLSTVSFDSTGSRLATTNAVGMIHVWNLRSIRRQLKGMNLDWDVPDLASDPWEGQGPRTIAIDQGK